MPSPPPVDPLAAPITVPVAAPITVPVAVRSTLWSALPVAPGRTLRGRAAGSPRRQPRSFMPT